jgi:hypothetical protein
MDKTLYFSWTCVFFLLPRKNKECYIEMFQYLLDVCTQENLELYITHLNLDFEYAAHEAARHFWPEHHFDTKTAD